MDFSFLFRGLFVFFVVAVFYFLVDVYREIKTIKKSLEKIERHLEQTNEATTELEGLPSSNSLRFDVQLKKSGRQKMPIVKEVRDLTGLGLRETKEMVESAPVIIQKKVRREEAEDTKKRLEALGAVVEIVQTQLV